MSGPYRSSDVQDVPSCKECGSQEDVTPCTGCGKPVCPGHRFGSGELSDGYQCSMACMFGQPVREETKRTGFLAWVKSLVT